VCVTQRVVVEDGGGAKGLEKRHSIGAIESHRQHRHSQRHDHYRQPQPPLPFTNQLTFRRPPPFGTPLGGPATHVLTASSSTFINCTHKTLSNCPAQLPVETLQLFGLLLRFPMSGFTLFFGQKAGQMGLWTGEPVPPSIIIINTFLIQ